MRTPVDLFLFPVCRGSQGPNVCRGLKTHPGSWRQDCASAEGQPSNLLCVEGGGSICLPPSPDCCDRWFPGSKSCCVALGSRRQALEERGNQAKLTEMLEDGCRDCTQPKEDGTCQHQHPCPAQEVSAPCWCAQFCWGHCLLFQLALILRILLCPIRCLAPVCYPVALC